ncbi:MAG: hypothetical protein H6541_02710 [Lentimicrobiaceae bacterium]|nr:hypothetical protein [Lentimicrobiaceae bacterium]MCB9023562.1 hypothetical protein [Lentimicrobiaceae bacterium]MCO5266019.1 hypothetical protein [Lentimicrobium sp.]
MKKLILILIALPLLFTSCENKKQTAKIAELEQDLMKQMSQTSAKDSLINDFLETLNQIESNLAEIKTKEKLISQETASGTELNKPARERINENIKLINELMQENKQKIASLNSKLKSSKAKITELETELKNMIELTNQQLAERDQQIAGLKEELANLNFSVAMLNDTISNIRNQNKTLQGVVLDKTNEINTAYFVVGPRKELIEKKILNKQGGFLGLGKTQKLSGDVNLSDFTQVDIRQLKNIPLGVKKANLISVHPAGSYELVMNNKKVEELIIKDPALFWQKSRMLVISTEI